MGTKFAHRSMNGYMATVEAYRCSDRPAVFFCVMISIMLSTGSIYLCTIR